METSSEEETGRYDRFVGERHRTVTLNADRRPRVTVRNEHSASTAAVVNPPAPLPVPQPSGSPDDSTRGTSPDLLTATAAAGARNVTMPMLAGEDSAASESSDDTVVAPIHPADPVAKRIRLSRQRCPCAICERSMTQVRVHCLRRHLPWYFHPELACWTCQKTVGSSAELKSKHLRRHSQGAFSTQKQLVAWLQSMQQYLKLFLHFAPPAVEQLCDHYEEKNDKHPSAVRDMLLSWVHNWGLNVDPQTPVDLAQSSARMLEWSVHIELLAKMDASNRQQLRYLPAAPLPTQVPALRLRVSDGHCHLRLLATQMRTRNVATGIARARQQHHSTLIAGLDVLIDNRVFPNSWGHHQQVPGVEVRTAVGAHPRMANSFIPWDDLEEAIQRPECVAVGECGLDTTVKGKPDLIRASQEEILRKQVKLANKHGRTLVLHVRDERGQVDGLYAAVLRILEEELIPGHPIYLHSFTGSLEAYRKFRDFSNSTCVGVSWATHRSPNFNEVVTIIPLEHLALETDAPFLPPPSTQHRVNSPFLLEILAQEIASRRNLPVSVILELSRLNIAHAYQLPL